MRRFNEDQIIAHDMRVFGDWALKDEGDLRVASFSDGNRQVTLANVHRTGVETSTGADLIYYAHDWDAYVLVQQAHGARDGRGVVSATVARWTPAERAYAPQGATLAGLPV